MMQFQETLWIHIFMSFTCLSLVGANQSSIFGGMYYSFLKQKHAFEQDTCRPNCEHCICEQYLDSFFRKYLINAELVYWLILKLQTSKPFVL